MGKEVKKITETTTTSADDTRFDELFDSGIRCTTAYLHQAIMAPPLPAERTISQAKLPGMQLSWTPAGLLLKFRGKRVTIPAANVANCNH